MALLRGMKTRDVLLIMVLSILLLLPSNNTLALSSSTNFRIWSDSISSGGNRSTSTNFITEDTISESATDENQSSTNFLLDAGLPTLFEEPVVRMTISANSIGLSPGLSSIALSSASYTVQVSTNSDSGYSLLITEDGALRSGGNSVGDVTDGSVTLGSSEYGVSVAGSHASFADDRAITASPLTLASSTTRTTGTTTTITHRASVTSGTPVGSYSHVVTLTVAANY